MHELIWRYWECEGGDAVLVPLAADCGASTIACFAARGGSVPIWIAKVARTRDGCDRLRREQAALARLAPWHARIRLPRILEWREAAADSCLIQTGLAGRTPRWRASRRGLVGKAREVTEAIASWILELQTLVPSPRAAGVQQLAAEWLSQNHGPAEPWMPAELNGALEDALRDSEELPAVATHGDLWYGNALWRSGLAGITDWCGFDAGTPLDDLLSFLIKCPARNKDRPALFRALFFDGKRLSRQAWALAARLAPPASWRLCFYFFLARRLWWEAGRSYQFRSADERADSRAEWEASLAWLAERGFPAPWANLG
ncbi:MAG: phosphotransferase family protein [Terriglobales bacterium]